MTGRARMQRASARGLRVGLAFVCLLAVGCRTPPPPAPFTGPALESEVSYYAGSAFAPEIKEVELPIAPEDFASVRMRSWVLEKEPNGPLFETLASRARAIVTYPGRLAPATTLGRDVRVGRAEDSARLEPTIAGPRSVTRTPLRAVLSGPLVSELKVKGEAVEVAIAVARQGSELAWTLILTQRVPAPRGSWPEVVLHEERILLDPDWVAGSKTLVVLVPWPLLPEEADEEEVKTRAEPVRVVLEVAVGRAPVPAAGGEEHSAHGEAVEHCRDRLLQELLDQAARRERAQAPWAPTLAELEPLRYPRSRRSTLGYLAERTGARLCGDVALAGDSELLRAVTDKLLALDRVPSEVAAFGWMLEETVLTLLADDLAAGVLPPERATLLILRAGEVGRHAGQLGDFARAAEGVEDFDARLLSANLRHLAANEPADRVRAYDWLRRRDQAPAGFDPLAPKAVRTAALRAALEALR